MNLITALIKPFKLDDIREALTAAGVTGMTISDVRGFGQQKGQVELYKGAEYQVDFLSKLKVEVAVNDDILDKVIFALKSSGTTGRIGDGKVIVMKIAHAVLLRNGETGTHVI